MEWFLIYIYEEKMFLPRITKRMTPRIFSASQVPCDKVDFIKW